MVDRIIHLGHPPLFPYGVIRPDTPGMAGLPAGVSLTTVSTGNITINNTGPTGPAGGVPFTGTGTLSDPFLLYHLQTDGIISVATNKYVHILECDLQCTTFGTTDGGIVNTSSSTVPHLPDQVTIERCEIHQLKASWLLDGIYGHGWTSIRNHIYHVQDGYGSLCTVSAGIPNAYNKSAGNFIEKMVYFQGRDQFGANTNPGGNDDATAVLIDGSHADCLQIQGGSYHEFYGDYFCASFDNTMVGGVTPWIRLNNTDATATGNGHSYYGTLNGNSAVQVNQNQGTSFPVNNVTFDKCWFDGGRIATTNWSNSGYVQGGGMQFDGHTVTNCRWGRRVGSTPGYFTGGDTATVSPAWSINTPPSSDLWTRITWTGDQYEDDGTAVPIRRGSTTIVGYAT